MSSLERFSISIPAKLAQQFDARNRAMGYDSRSEAIRDLIRDALIRQECQDPAARVAATITMVYDHHTRQLMNTLTEVQHDFGAVIISTLHVHLDHDNCLEVLVTRGPAGEVQRLADTLQSLKGLKHCQVTMTTEGKSPQ